MEKSYHLYIEQVKNFKIQEMKMKDYLVKEELKKYNLIVDTESYNY